MRDYSELQQTIIDYMNRDDLGSVVQLFIANAESVMWQDLIVRAMEKRWETEAPIPDADAGPIRFIDTPPRYVRMRRFHMQTASLIQLDPIPPEDMATWFQPGNGRPQKFCVQGAQIEFNQGFESNYLLEMTFIQEPVALGSEPDQAELETGQFPTEWLDSNGKAVSNSVLNQYFHIYVERSMVEANLWSQDYEQAALWEAKYDSSVMTANRRATRSRTTGGTLVQRADTNSP